MKIFIGCSANEDIEEKYKDDCIKLFDIILKDNDLVFGACDKGIMGLAYKIAKKHDRNITAILPVFYKKKLDNLSCNNVVVVKSMLESTLKIYDNCDIILILPGGYGTVYELFCAIQSKICNETNKKIILYNSYGYYDKLIEFMNKSYKEGFSKNLIVDIFFVANTNNDVINYIK